MAITIAFLLLGASTVEAELLSYLNINVIAQMVRTTTTILVPPKPKHRPHLRSCSFEDRRGRYPNPLTTLIISGSVANF